MANNFVKQIKTAMYDTPTDYKTSQDYYTETLQQKINETFEFTSDAEEIGEEKVFGTLEYTPIVCRINHAIEPKTGNNLGDDFRELKFKELQVPRYMGQRYRFQNSDWISVNTDNYKYITKSAVVRRCNNELRWVDIETGTIVSEPCIIDYTIKYANLYFNHTVDIAQGTLLLTTQYNQWTRSIKINDRFILGGQAYKVKMILDALRQATYEQEITPLITFQIYVDTEAADDNFTPFIGKQYNPIYPENIANYNRYKDIFEPSQKGDVNVVISPNKTVIPYNESITFSCYAYDENGNKMTDTFDFSFSGITTAYYTSTVVDGNHFTIYNKKPNVNKKLTVVCKNSTYEKEIMLEMGGMF